MTASETYYLETDGSVRPGERHKSGNRPSVGGAGVVLYDPRLKLVFAESVPLGQVTSGTEAEFRAVVVGLQRALERNIRRLRVFTDSQQVVSHLTGKSSISAGWAARLTMKVAELRQAFEVLDLRWTRSVHSDERRAGVPTADALARRAIRLGLRQKRE